ncbi:hypothetical protein Tco_0672672 [Tanacetum coccineum]
MPESLNNTLRMKELFRLWKTVASEGLMVLQLGKTHYYSEDQYAVSIKKIRRIRACTHQRPQKIKDQYAVFKIWNQYNILEDIKRGPYSKKSPICRDLDNSTNNVLIPLDSCTSGLLVYRLILSVLKPQDGCSTHNLAHKRKLESLPSKNQWSFSDLVINKLKKKVKRLEKKQRARTPKIKLFKIGTSRRKGLDKENASKQGRKLKTRLMFEEVDFNDDFDDIDDMVNEEMENVEGYTVNTAATRVSDASASVTTAGVSISTVEPRIPPTTTITVFEDEDLTIAQTLVKMRNYKDKEKGKGVAFRAAQEESARPTRILPTIDLKDKGKGIMQEPEKPPKNPRKAQIQMDKELSMRLHEEEKAALERMQRDWAAQEEASNASLTAEFDDVQARMDEDAMLAARLQKEEKVQFSIDEQARFLLETITERKREQKWINDFVPIDSKVVKESRKGKAEGGRKKTVARKRIGEKLDDKRDDEAVNVESLAMKYLIVDWKTHILTENMMYYQIIRADESFKNYKIFSKMLGDFDKQDVLDLYRMVKERFETTSPEGYDILL